MSALHKSVVQVHVSSNFHQADSIGNALVSNIVHIFQLDVDTVASS